MRDALREVSWSIKAERARRLGLLAYLAFGRFVDLYRKYDEDQPRDDRGRWTETGAEDDVDVTGSTGSRVVQRSRTGIQRIDRVTERLEQIVVESVDEVGEGSGPLYGLRVHGEFARRVREADIPGVSVEKPWHQGDAVTASILGSIRTDVVLHQGEDRSGPAVAAWDLKTGGAALWPSRAAEIRRGLGVGPEVPVIELHVIRGTFNKALPEARGTGV